MAAFLCAAAYLSYSRIGRAKGWRPGRGVLGLFEVAVEGGGQWGTLPRRSGREGCDPCGQCGEVVLPDEAGGQGNLDPGDHLGDACGNLDEAEPEGVELGVAPERSFGRQVPQAVHQPVGGGVDHQAELVGGSLGAGGAVRGQVELMGLDQVFGLSAGAIDLFVEHMLQSLEIGDDEAGIDAERRGLDTGDDPAFGLPTLGAIAKFTEAPDFFLVRMGVPVQDGAGHVALNHAGQHRIAGQSEDVADRGALTPRHGLGPAIVAVAAHDDLDLRPPGTQSAHHMAYHQGNFGAGRGLARPQEHRHRLARRRLVDVDGHEAVAVVMGVEQRQLLFTVGSILSVVNVEHQATRRLLEAVAEQRNHRRHQTTAGHRQNGPPPACCKPLADQEKEG